jgi:hypothetical protein
MPNHWLSALCPVHQAPSLSLRVLWRSLGRFCRYNILKDLADAAMQSLSRTALERGQNFARTKILPFLHEGIFVKLHIV